MGKRLAAGTWPILRLHDTIELSFRRKDVAAVGMRTRMPARKLDGKPQGRDRVDWKLITDLPVASRKEAVEKLNWYAMRWKIEVFHTILKSGCRAEASKLRTANRLVNLISVLAILSWRIFWMTMTNRAAPDADPTVAFTPLEMKLLDQLINDQANPNPAAKSLSAYLTKLARLGGYLARVGDSPPGNMVVWRGLSRLTDIHLGYLLGTHLMGN